MTNHEPKHPPIDMAGLDGLIERLRNEAEVERHYDDFQFNTLSEAATQPQALAARVKVLEGENERLREALAAYTEYCHICHGRGHIIEEDSVTGADLWRDCPGCIKAREALENKE